MPKLFAIIRREFVERVRTKAFLIGTLMGPLIFFAVGALPGLMFGKPSGAQAIAVIDATAGQVSGRLLDSLAKETLVTAEGPIRRYRFVTVTADPARTSAVRDSILPDVDRRPEGGGAPDPDALTGILVVTDTGLASGHVAYLGKNVGSIGDMSHLERALRASIIRERILAMGVSANVAEVATSRVDLTTAKVTKGKLTGEGAESAFWLSYILIIILFIALMPTGVQIMSAVVEEKSNRILEVLVSSVRPFDLMLGKVLGVGAASLLQLGIWGASATLLGRLSGGQGGVAAGAQQATEGAERVSMTLPAIPTDLIVVTLIYFALGFLFFATAYAAVGAMCNTVQETQQVQFPVMGMLLAGYLGAFATIGRPESTAAKVMSFLPPTAPFIVPTRWSNAPLPLTELIGSIAICVLGVLGMVWLAARIYRVGILSYGKKPSFKDIWTWVRAS
jgi:ABC-2 type transport system permease protein